jgi:hypothetical protein
MNLRPARSLPARSALLALTALLLLTARGGVPAAHGDPTVIATVPCGAIIALVDGNAANPITSADIDAACGIGGTPLPPTGTRSIAALAAALGNQNGVLEFNDFIGIPSLNVNQIAASCTAPSPTCTLDSFVFVNSENSVFFDLPVGLRSVETGGDVLCASDGVTLTTDNDCSSVIPGNGDGVVLFHIVNGTAAEGSLKTVTASQSGVDQVFNVFIGTIDTDGDGMPDAYENAHRCLNAAVADGAADPDADGKTSFFEYLALGTDPCVFDTDGDSVGDGVDNCPLTANTDQLNTDNAPIFIAPLRPLDITVPNGDRLGDACDPDKDNDGLPDAVEAGIGGAPSPPNLCPSATAPTNPLLADSDGDRVLDGAECALGTDPMNPLSKPPTLLAGDTDHDGLPDTLEVILGSDPLKIDTDGDKINDGIEFKGYNTSPALPDTDGDGCGDGREIASVNDDLSVNVIDLLVVAKNFDRTDRPAVDVNKDGKINVIDLLTVRKNFTSTPTC